VKNALGVEEKDNNTVKFHVSCSCSFHSGKARRRQTLGHAFLVHACGERKMERKKGISRYAKGKKRKTSKLKDTRYLPGHAMLS
jgi:hypothetical protein